MADKPPPPPDQNILVYVPDYQNATLQTTVNTRKPVYYRGYESPRSDSVRSETAESTCSSLSSTDTLVENEQSEFKQESVAPPFGWKRILTNGIVIYVSPSNTVFSNTDQIKAYLQTEGTCKCGLECPLDCESTFNFDPKVLTRAWTAPVIGPGELTKLCNHKRKLLTAVDNVDNRYVDGVRKKKRKVITTQPSVSQLLAQRERDRNVKDQQNYSNLPWRGENVNSQYPRGVYTNGYQDGGQFRYQECNMQYQRVQEPPRYPGHMTQNHIQQQHINPNQNHFQQPQVQYDNRVAYPQQQFDPKYSKPPLVRLDYSQAQEVHPNLTNTVQSSQGLTQANRTPPWHPNRQQPNVFERVPPLHHHNPPVPVWNADLKKKQNKIVRKRFPEECPNVDVRNLTESPSFMDDPSGYLAQQTALLNSTISRQNVNSPCVQEGVPIASNINKFAARPKCKNFVTSRFPDSSGERKKEEPSSTLTERTDERGPIQGGTVSTSNRSLVESRPADSRNIVTTMASGHTASSNTITSVLAGRANTVTVSVNNQTAPQKSHLDMVQNVVSNIQPEVMKQGHILVSSNGQLIVANSMLAQQQNVQKISPTSSSVSQIGVSPQVLSQPTVLVNTLPGPLLLQPSVMVDGINTVQIPQLVGNMMQQNQVMEENNLLSPDSKRKVGLKKRKLSPTVGSMLLSPQSTNNVMVPQQQINTPMLQALTILPSKANFAGTQQLITTNMLQPLNLVQNFPIQQFIVPAGVSGMVMSDGTILQDTVQLNLLTPVQNTAVFSNGQNLIAPGMVIRTPTSQNTNKVIQSNQFLSSPNQFLVNNTFGGQLSPMLSMSPNQGNRNQEYMPQNVVVQQQPNTTNTTVVQQNTTIVQQTTMVSNQQTQPTPTLNLNQNFILNDKPNFILTSEKQNFILSPNNDKIIINPDNIRGNFVVSNIDKQNFVINNMEKPNLIINNFDKNFMGNVMDKKNSVSTQTQNQQVLQISSSPALVVATNNALCHTSTYSGSPPDTTTLSPVDQEVSTSLQPTSPDQSLPMVHCVSSSNQQEDNYQIESYNGKQVTYVESSCMPLQSLQDKDITQDEYASKMSICTTPDSGHMSATQESDGVVN